MQNILITYLSPLPKNKIMYGYRADNNINIEAFYTNEPGVRYLKVSMDKQGIKLDKIIAVCSDSVIKEKYEYAGDITTYQYFCNMSRSCFPDVDIIAVESAEPGDVLGVFEKLSIIEQQSNIYLDITGGFRDAVYTLTLISKFLEFKGMTVRRVIYSMPGKLKDYTGNFRLMNLINGVSEFVNFGNSDTIERFFEASPNNAIKAVIENMKRFNDAITLGKILNLNNIISDLSQSILLCEQSRKEGVDELVFSELIPVIREKFMGDNGAVSYFSVISWCVDNNLIQQALTIYIEKIPELIFENKWLEYKGDYNEIKKRARINLYEYMYYSDFLDIDNSITGNFRDQARLVARSGRGVSRSLMKSGETAHAFIRYNKILELFGNKGRYIDLAEARRKNAKAEKEWDEALRNAWNILMKKDTNPELYMVTNSAFYNTLLGISSETNDSTMQKKIDYLMNFEQNLKVKSGIYVLNIKESEIKRISVAYVFFKAIRNEINHASDIENLNSEQKRFFADKDLEYKMDVQTLKNQILREIEFMKGIAYGDKTGVSN